MIGRHQGFFFACSRTGDVDGRKDPFVRDLAIEDEFGIAGAFELFEDHFVHAAAGIDQRGGENRQRAAFFDIARRAEKALGSLQSVGVDAAVSSLPDEGATVL